MRDAASESPALAAGVEAVVLAQAELRALVYRLADEVASFRRRALAAEARQRELEESLLAHLPATEPASAAEPEEGAVDAAALSVRVAELEVENAGLHERLERAGQRTRQLLERTRFLRQQQDQGEEGG